jgi:hypothetical protein
MCTLKEKKFLMASHACFCHTHNSFLHDDFDCHHSFLHVNFSLVKRVFFFFKKKKKMGYLISPPIRRQSVWTHACFTLLEVLCIKFLPLSNINMNN